MSTSSIEWTEHTWNPVTGCSKVSPGCAHCYAETVALRFWPTQYRGIPIVDPNKPARVNGGPNSTRRREFTDVMTHADRLDQPLRRKKPTTYFVNSMSDLFHEDVPDEFIGKVFDRMAQARRHTFQVLTKRAERMLALLPTFAARHTAADGSGWPLPNVWLGVSVENQRFADERIPLLLQTPAAVRFISAEPLLGPIRHLGQSVPGLDWCIVGGESGPGARPFDLAWARSIVQQCKAAGVACFVKQLGSNPENAGDGGLVQVTIRDRKGGDIHEFPRDLRVREFPASVPA